MPVQTKKSSPLLILTAVAALAACNGEEAKVDSGSPPGADQGPADVSLSDTLADSGKTTEQQLKPDQAPPKPAHWSLVPSTGAIPVGESMTATLLSDGKVLITGGLRSLGAGDEFEDKAYLYDPTGKQFVATGKMTEPRAYHTATLLTNGQVLVVGGKNSKAYLKTAELFDPKTGTFTATAKSMPYSRWDHAAVRLNKDSMVLVSGGFGSSDSVTSMVLYHPGQKDWILPPASMTEKRRGHSMTLLKTGKVLIAGGIQGKNSWTYVSSNTMELFDTAGTITALKDNMNYRRAFHSANLIPSTGNVLIVGGVCWGNDCSGTKVNDLYKAASNSVSKVSSLGNPPVGHATAVLKDSRVLVVGSNADDPKDRKKAVIYTPGGGLLAWKAAPDMLVARSHAVAVALNDGTVLVAGGIETKKPYTYAKKAELFHPGPPVK